MTKAGLCNSGKQHEHTQVSLRKPLRCGLTVLLCSCLLFGAAQCRAQETRDAAEAARQERARKEQSKQQKHVYTEEDLGRAKILTPDDQARFAAQRQQLLAPPPNLPAQDSLDASTELPQLPLGDVARRYRDAKRATQAPTPFHLPFDEPVLAAPVVPILRVTPPHANVSPVRPSLAPSHTHAVPAPSVSNPEPLRRIDPFTRRSGPAAAAALDRQPNLVPSTSSRIAPPVFAARKFAPPALQPDLAPPIAASPRPQPNVDPKITVAPTAKPSSSPLHVVAVLPGDSLWKLAQQNLGRGSRWRELMAANPSIVNPMHLTVGTEIIVPAQVTGLKSDVTVTVEPGDTLSKLAEVMYGRVTAWRCIAQVNPQITDANRIYAGQQLLLPFSCQQ